MKWQRWQTRDRGERDGLKEAERERARERSSQCLINETLQRIETLPDLCPLLIPSLADHTHFLTDQLRLTTSENVCMCQPTAAVSTGAIIFSAYVYVW